MIKQLKYNSTEERHSEVLSYLANKPTKQTVIDVGASLNPWGQSFITATVDLNEASLIDTTHFRGDINNIHVWDGVLDYVAKNGKFDFCICTHTLEDISNPIFVVNMLSKIANEGFVAVPSKYVESRRNGGPCRGWLHHRWIFNNENEKVIAYPKLPSTEHLECLDQVALEYGQHNSELSFFWEGVCDIEAVNGDFFPSDAFALNIYKNLLTD